MSAFLAAILSFPTVVFTGVLGVVVVYWLFVVLGFVDENLFHAGSGADALHGGGDGALDGGHESLADGGDAGHDVGDAGGGGHDGGGDGSDHADADSGDGDHGHHGRHGLGDVLGTLGLRGVPLTISLSFLILWSWLLSLGGTLLFNLERAEGARALVGGSAVGLGALAFGVAAAALSIRPLRRVYAHHAAPGRSGLVGKVCTVTTLRVDDGFGQADVRDEQGASFVVPVRCATPNPLTRGASAYIYEYDREGEVFRVAPLDPTVGDPAKLLAQLRAERASSVPPAAGPAARRERA